MRGIYLKTNKTNMKSKAKPTEETSSEDKSAGDQPVTEGDMDGFCSKVVGQKDPERIRDVLQCLIRYLSEQLDGQHKLTKKRLQRLQAKTLQVLHLCHIKFHQCGQPTLHPAYEDMVAALLSQYVDIILLARRQVQNDEVPTHLNADLTCRVATYILSHSPAHLLDVLLQLSQATANDDSMMVPLCKRLLVRPENLKSETIYTKYVCAVRLMSDIYDLQLSSLKQDTSGIKAPKEYLNWIRDQDPDILDHMPETPKFRYSKITRFILEEADSELVESLLDILTTSGSVGEDTKINGTETVDNAPLFVIDTAGNGKPTEDEGDTGMFVIDKAPDAGTKHMLKEFDIDQPAQEDVIESGLESENEVDEPPGSDAEDVGDEWPTELDEMPQDDNLMDHTLKSLDNLLKEARRKSYEEPKDTGAEANDHQPMEVGDNQSTEHTEVEVIILDKPVVNERDEELMEEEDEKVTACDDDDLNQDRPDEHKPERFTPIKASPKKQKLLPAETTDVESVQVAPTSKTPSTPRRSSTSIKASPKKQKLLPAKTSDVESVQVAPTSKAPVTACDDDDVSQVIPDEDRPERFTSIKASPKEQEVLPSETSDVESVQEAPTTKTPSTPRRSSTSIKPSPKKQKLLPAKASDVESVQEAPTSKTPSSPRRSPTSIKASPKKQKLLPAETTDVESVQEYPTSKSPITACGDDDLSQVISDEDKPERLTSIKPSPKKQELLPAKTSDVESVLKALTSKTPSTPRRTSRIKKSAVDDIVSDSDDDDVSQVRSDEDKPERFMSIKASPKKQKLLPSETSDVESVQEAPTSKTPSTPRRSSRIKKSAVDDIVPDSSGEETVITPIPDITKLKRDDASFLASNTTEESQRDENLSSIETSEHENKSPLKKEKKQVLGLSKRVAQLREDVGGGSRPKRRRASLSTIDEMEPNVVMTRTRTASQSEDSDVSETRKSNRRRSMPASKVLNLTPETVITRRRANDSESSAKDEAVESPAASKSTRRRSGVTPSSPASKPPEEATPTKSVSKRRSLPASKLLNLAESPLPEDPLVVQSPRRSRRLSLASVDSEGSIGTGNEESAVKRRRSTRVILKDTAQANLVCPDAPESDEPQITGRATRGKSIV